ncbi:MAG: putative multiple sugar transport system permease protein [Frankiaceae bacterium]|jgi:putative multiple sugar transport system permease protein|nr:putative multiple sugar transport system permease protein [Frankiaceae bacterium]
MSSISDLRKMFGGGTSAGRQFGMVFVLAAILLFFNWRTHGLTLGSANMIQLAAQYSYILILAIGMVMVIIAGHIDLSVGSVAAFSGIAVALLINDQHLPWPLAVVAGLLIGAVIGAWQGFWVAIVGVPAFIVTLAGMLIFRGANQYLGNSTAAPVPAGFQKIGAGYLPEVGPDTGKNNLTLLIGLVLILALIYREMRLRSVQSKLHSTMAPLWVSLVKLAILAAIIGYATMLFAGGRPGTSIPISGLILAVLVVIYSYIARNTIIGRNIYAVGGNGMAAKLSGVNTRRVNFLVMTNMGMLSALAGMIFVARSGASGAQDGLGWELDAIAAVFIGGAAISGGVGTVIGSIVGGLVMAVLNNGLQLLGVGSDRVQIIKGLVLLIAVALDVYNKNQGRPSLIGFMTNRFRSGPQPVAAVPVGSASEELPVEAEVHS